MTNTTSSPDSVHPPASQYSHAVEVPAGSRTLYLSGQIGLDHEGNASGDFAEQADQTYRNVAAILEHHGFALSDVVKMTHYLTDPSDIPAYREVRSRWLGDARPASTLLVVSALARPHVTVEVEVVAAKA